MSAPAILLREEDGRTVYRQPSNWTAIGNHKALGARHEGKQYRYVGFQEGEAIFVRDRASERLQEARSRRRRQGHRHDAERPAASTGGNAGGENDD